MGVYLDNNATTPVRPEVLEAMLPFLTEHFANPSSGYHLARPVKRAIDLAREEVAALLGAKPEEIIFTSGGTESDNTSLASAVASLPDRRHGVISNVEHPAVEEYCQYLERMRGFRITRLTVDERGEIDLEELDAAILPEQTAFVSLMWANNETGVLFPVETAAALAAAKGVFFHTDAVQAVGKTGICLKDTAIHYLSLSAHKLHGPKGVGVMFASERVPFHVRMLGGGQEKRRRGGTENVAGIVGLGAAAGLMRAKLAKGSENEVRLRRDRFERALKEGLTGIQVNGHLERRLCNTSNLAFDGIEAPGLLILLDEVGVWASGGSACHTGSLHPSPVLSAMGLDRDRALSSIRFSLSSFTSDEEVDDAVEIILNKARKMRAMRSGSCIVQRSDS